MARRHRKPWRIDRDREWSADRFSPERRVRAAELYALVMAGDHDAPLEYLQLMGEQEAEDNLADIEAMPEAERRAQNIDIELARGVINGDEDACIECLKRFGIPIPQQPDEKDTHD
jgi:hypothetical protein